MSPGALPSGLLYPNPSEAALAAEFIGKEIAELDTPAIIIDRAVVRRNCNAMLDTVDRLQCSLRVHVKTHKVSANPTS
jgi:D-serine deaminase-like pyridoxal phosphate-dependent protein